MTQTAAHPKHQTTFPFVSRLDTHSTTPPNYCKYDFRDVSLSRVHRLHERTLAIYKKIHDAGGHNLATQYERCRTDAWVVQNEDTQMLRIASRKCNQRWCPMCAKTKRWIITNSVSQWVRTAHHPKLLSFTLKSSDATLELQVSRLYDAFVAIRKKAWWKRKVSGGVWFFQMTINPKTNLWHPHLHVLVDGDYIAKRIIQDAWRTITFDSYIVDIRKVDDPEKTAEYVARYATIPGDLLKCTISQGSAMVIGLKGRRMCGSFGTAKGIALRPKKMDEKNPWRKVMSFTALSIGSTYDPYIAEIAKAFENGKPFAADLWGMYDTPDIPKESLEYKPESAQSMLFDMDDCYFVNGRMH